ncbi:MAG: GNAT family N-acetyltransferase [Gemmatimonadetes bacterium]|nr:GNAT family N-acetyltransferase [Gemmatimonadota bacterium]
MQCPVRSGTTATSGSLIQPSGLADSTTHLRPLRLEDIPALVELRGNAFRSTERPDPNQLAAYFERVFFHNPWRDDELPSLVYQNASGKPAGFIGVIPRAMTFRGQPIRVAVATQMMVAPEERGLAGRKLVRALLSGPQDLTLSDTANETARRVWMSVGARHALVYGFGWERVLRPGRHRGSRSGGGSIPLRAAAYAARPLLAAGDAVAARMSGAYRLRPAAGTLEPLDAETICRNADRILENSSLHPRYDPDSLAWLLAQAGEKRQFGSLAGGIVRGETGEVEGWFVHYVQPGETSQVLQVAAPRNAQELVMEHLLHDARNHGAIAVAGRLDPSMISALGTPNYRLRHQPPWTLYYSRRPEINQAIDRGDAFISRLDGEWWLSF